MTANIRLRRGLMRACFLLPCLLFRLAGATVISGHVTDSLTHAPIAGAGVAGSSFVFPAPPQDFSTQTDADGFYAVDVPSGNYSAAVSADSYLTIYANVDVASDPVVADFAMSHPGTISGTVRAANAGVAFAKIALFDADQGTFEAGTASQADGTYLLDGLVPGSYAICVIDPNDIYLDQCYSGFDIPASGARTFTPLTLHSGDTLDPIDFDLHAGSTITGTLSDSYASAPIANGDITFVLYSSTQQVLETLQAPTDADGQFVIGGIAAGSYYLEAGAPFVASPVNSYYVSALHAGGECLGGVPCTFTDASLFTVPAGGTASGIDFPLRPGHLVSGKVSDAETGLGIGAVTVKTCEWIGLIFKTAEATTAADGTYTLAHVVGPGEVSVSTSNALGYVDLEWPNFPRYGGGDCAAVFEGPGITFNSADQNIPDINFSLVRAASISGHVTPSAAGSTATVEILADFGGSLGTVWSDSPDANGDYHADGLPPGTYYALVYFDAYQDCRVYAGYACTDPSGFPPIDPQQATPITIAAGQARGNIDFPAVQEIFGNSFE